MSALFTKLNLKDQKTLVVLGSPASFEAALAELEGVAIVRDLRKAKACGFALAFVTTQDEVDTLAPALAAKAEGDVILWFAYPKRSSKRYKSAIDRDHGWDAMGREGFEPVRMVAIDEDWSAVRFRRATFIQKMTRGAEHRLVGRGATTPTKSH